MAGDWPSQGDEMAAMLWSCAAAEALELPLEFVFHPNGYKGSSEWLIDNYRNKTYTGLNLLEWFGMTLSEKRAAQENKAAFPVMQRWLRD
ncbi:hypothetical protein [Flavobacterium sp. 3HN19-14]|uniref:hypothetical protein n=1 Tax=Flavobacterium sp. 3HN19-14 TaxID=3448133 RepID=UPI003EE10EC8